MMNAEQILVLAESVWRRVLTELSFDGFDVHEDCDLDDPNECALFCAITEEISKANVATEVS
jgi:hypothetical protein